MDDFGLLVGRYHATLPTISNDQCLSELVLDQKGRLVISGRWLEDEQHTSGDAGLFALGVRDDGVHATVVYDTVTFTADNGGIAGNDIDLVFDGIDDLDTVVNAWNAANPDNTVSFSGQLGTYVPAAGTADLDGGTADTVFTDANYDYTPIATDKYGRLKTVTDLDVDFDFVYAEDSAHTSGDLGGYVMTVRSDSRPTNANTDADGDYASFFVNANGELYVHDTDALTKLTEIDTVLDNIYTEQLEQGTVLDTISAEIQSITHEEDTAHASGHDGIMPLAVRNDAGAVLADTDGDYIPLSTNNEGALWVVPKPLGNEQYTVTDALAAAGDGLETITSSATPWVTVASYANPAGQTAFLYAYQWACDDNAQMRIITDDTSDIKVYKTDINSSAKPGTAEAWGESGRIEIPGAASLVIKLQIKKRHDCGSDGNGTGSMHIRTA